MIKERRHDIDWIRVLVFDLLILYHVGMFFVPWGWHIKNETVTEFLILPMLFINQWRLPILFVVSGMGTRFALSRRSAKKFAKERIIRLFIPLVFGMLFIVPPQVYVERLSEGATYTSFLNFYPHYFNGIYPNGNFSWHHLWFLPYLLVYSLIFTPLFLFLRKKKDSLFLKKISANITKYPLILYIFALPLLCVEIPLKPLFPQTHAFVGDWYALPMYAFYFLSGFLLIMIKDVLWQSLQKIRYLTLSAGIVLFSTLIWGWNNDLSHEIVSLVRILNLWSWILTIFGFASKYLNRPSAVLAYRNQAVYPFYILHQTITIIIGYYLMDLDMSIALKFLIMAVGTFAGTWLLYEGVIRRIAFLQPLFGLKKKTRF